MRQTQRCSATGEPASLVVPLWGHDPARGSGGDRRSRGFTIVELLIIVAILGTVAGIGVSYYRDALEKARIARTMADVRVLEKDLAIYKLDAQKFPDSLAELGRGNRLDAWGRSFEYVRFCEPGETRSGRDRGRGGADRGDRDRGDRDRDRGGGGDPDEDRGRGDGDRDDRDRGDRDRGNRDRGDRDRDDRDRGDRDRGRDGDGRREDDDSDDCESRLGKMRKDKFLKPLNSDYDLYSVGKDGESKRQLDNRESRDDVIRAVDGMYVGLASEF